MSAVIQRIQKLLRLASNAGSEAEAALAAERARALMAQHEIHEAQLALDGANVRTPEPIEQCYTVTRTAKRVAWHMNVVSAVAYTYGAQTYWHGGSVVLFGRLSAVQAASYTSLYLMREIERLTDREARGYSRAYRNAFRLGASNRVAGRVRAEYKAAEEERRKAAQRGAAREHDGGEQTSHVVAAEPAPERAAASPAEPEWHAEPWACGHNDPIYVNANAQRCAICGLERGPGANSEPEPGDEPEGDEPEREGDHDDEQTEEEAEEIETEAEIEEAEEASKGVTEQALAVVDRDRAEVTDAYKNYSKKWRKGRALGNVSSGGGYRAGREAGERVKLGGRARGGLNAGQGSLKKGRR